MTPSLIENGWKWPPGQKYASAATLATDVTSANLNPHTAETTRMPNR